MVQMMWNVYQPQNAQRASAKHVSSAARFARAHLEVLLGPDNPCVLFRFPSDETSNVDRAAWICTALFWIRSQISSNLVCAARHKCGRELWPFQFGSCEHVRATYVCGRSGYCMRRHAWIHVVMMVRVIFICPLIVQVLCGSACIVHTFGRRWVSPGMQRAFGYAKRDKGHNTNFLVQCYLFRPERLQCHEWGCPVRSWVNGCVGICTCGVRRTTLYQLA